MRHQGYNDRLDEHLGRRQNNRSGRSHQSFSSRRHESEGMEKHEGRRKFSADREMDEGHRRHSGLEHHKMNYSSHGKGDYDRSPKHRRRESEGMKRYERGR